MYCFVLNVQYVSVLLPTPLSLCRRLVNQVLSILMTFSMGLDWVHSSSTLATFSHGTSSWHPRPPVMKLQYLRKKRTLMYDACTCTHSDTHIHARTPHTRTHTHTHTHTHARTHAHTHTQTLAYIHTYIHIHAYTHAHAHIRSPPLVMFCL